jgi:outer membrane receptor protein involved in Fe transport
VAHQQPAPGARVTSLAALSKSNVTYNFTVDWKPTDDMLLYATTRTGYIGGGVNALAPLDSTYRTYDPETVNNYEVGVKADWNLGNIRGRTNVALYNDNFKDIQRQSYFIVNGAPASLTSNLAGARYRGLEIETTIIPTSWFELSANLGLMRNKYKDWIEQAPCAGTPLPACATLPAGTFFVINHAKGVMTFQGNGVTVGPTFNFKPDRVPNSPRTLWMIQPTVKLREATGQDISISANIYHRSSYTGFAQSSSLVAGYPVVPQVSVFGGMTPLPPTLTEGYTLVDARIDWRTGPEDRVNIYAAVTNLTDKAYALGISQTVNLTGSTLVVPSAPRMVTVGASYGF